MDYKTLNKEQQEAITYGNGPLLIIAGAGSGKTTVITERIKHLITQKDIHPNNILALTFTEKAAQEMEERIDVAMPYGYTQMWIATFHAFCDRILRAESIHIGLNPSYKMLTEAESILFLKQNIFQLNLDYFRPLGNPTKFLQGLLQHFSRLKDEDITVKEYLEFALHAQEKSDEEILPDEKKQILELAHAYKNYEEIKAKEGIMDFSDLISNVLHLFRTRKHILAQYQKQFSYILIDEFQDTNYAQNQLALLLAGISQNITVVGDDDQAIYRWRGAAISNMLQFKTHFPETKIITLTKNYRSTSNILDSAYKLIQFNNPDRLEIKENINKHLSAARKVQGAAVDFILNDNVDNEAESVVKKIQELRQKKQFAWKDFAILVRANDHATSFMQTFERFKIPFQFLGPARLFHQEEIKDLIAYLKVLYNFEDSASLYRVLTMDIFQIPATDIAALLNFAKKENYTLFEVLGKISDITLTTNGKEAVEKIRVLLTKHLQLVSKETAGQILYFFLEESGLLQQYLDTKTVEKEVAAQNLAKFFERLKGYESQHDNASVFAIVDYIDLSMQMGESPLAASIDWTDVDAVNILTVHSSKGLEFPVVFLTNLVTQRFPSRERHEQIPIPSSLIKEVLPLGDFHLQEERRLFYVAMTRAKDMLFLTAANFYGEGKRERKLSPFIVEALGEEKVKQVVTQLKSQKEQLSLLDIFPTKALETNASIDTKSQKPIIDYISYSQLQSFDVCPLHYKLKYLLKIPTPLSANQSFGISIHNSLREFYLRAKQGEQVPEKDIEPLLKSFWLTEGYTSKKHRDTAYKQALSLLQKTIQQDFNPKQLPLSLETPFQFPIKNIKVGGRIDRIDDLGEGKIEIIDYKTGSQLPLERSVKNDLQLTIYALAATEIREPLFHKKPDEILLSLYYLEHNKKITTTRTREELDNAKITILEKVQAITQSDFACSGSIFCQNCEYKMLCKSSS